MASHVEKVPLLGSEEEDAGDITEEKVISPCPMAFEEDKSEPQNFVYDVFISYSASDRPWVNDVLLQTLEQEGKKVCIDYRDFQAGVPTADNIVNSIENSQVTVLVLTPAFVESEWCMYESKHALVSSLATSRARVLPLILVECDIPNILNHLTYLDHTSEYVQPYFKEQLIDNLNNAEKWMLADPRRNMSQVVEEIVVRNLEQNKRNNAAFSELKCAYRWFIFWKYVISSCPVLFLSFLLVIGYFVFFDYYAKIPKTSPVHPLAFVTTSSHMFTGFLNYDALPGSSQSFSMTNKNSKEPVVFDAYAYDELHSVKDVFFEKRRTTFSNASLSPKTVFKTENFSVHGFMSLTTKFCFHSQNSEQNATMRLYKPKTLHEIVQLSSQGNTSNLNCSGLISGLNSTCDKFEAVVNKTMCGSSDIDGQKLAANESGVFAFHNFGNSTIFLKLSITVAEISYRTELATHSCLGVKKCDIPFPDMHYQYIIMSTNSTHGPTEIVINRSYAHNVNIYFYRLLFLLASFCIDILFIHLQIHFIADKGVNDRLRKWYFQRDEFRERFGVWERWALVESRSLEQLKSIIRKRLERRENLTFIDNDNLFAV